MGERQPSEKRRVARWRPHLVALGFLGIVAAIYAWPLLSNLTTSIPGQPDFPDVTEYVWNTGWVRHALTSDDALLYTEALFVPFGADLRLSTFGMLQGFFAFPFTYLLGVVGAYNLILILTLFANGAVAYALFQRETNYPLAAFIAASWFMLAATVVMQITVGRSALGGLWIVTGNLLVMASLLEHPRLWKGVLLGLLLTAALFTDFQILLFSTLWLVLYFGYWGWQRRTVRTVLPSLLLAGAIVLVPFALIYYPALASAEAAGYPVPGFDSMRVYSFAIKHYLNPQLWWIVTGGYELAAAAFVAIIIFRWKGPYRFWLAGALVFLVLALGPYLEPTEIYGPFAAFSLWPPMRQFRTPGRLTIPATIGLAMVAALVLAHLLPHIRWRSIRFLLAAIAVGGSLLFANSRIPFVVQTYPEYMTYRHIASEPETFTLLEVPFSIRSGIHRLGNGGEVVQYYQHIHGKRLINGSMARLPTRLFEYYQEHPSLLFLSGRANVASDDVLDSDFSDVLAWSDARYVLVHGSLLNEAQAARIERFLNRQPALRHSHTEEDLVVFRVLGAEEVAADEDLPKAEAPFTEE